MIARNSRTGEFTGRHMLIVILSFFGVIIAVNVTMAVLARTSWTGLVVENTYVASQEFNRKAEEGRAQAALGWTGQLSMADSSLQYRLSDSSGRTIVPYSVRVTFRHPAYDRADVSLSLVPGERGAFTAAETIADGQWIVEIDADVGRAQPYRQVERIIVRQGTIR